VSTFRTEIDEFSPTEAYNRTMEVVMGNLAAATVWSSKEGYASL
jgi:hypothetical protein